jgi:outer membrane protein assembly factor BamA
VDVPSLTVGLTNNGTFLSDVTVNFSDLLGDQRISVRGASVAGYSDLSLAYINMKRRLDWGAAITDYRDYYLAADVTGQTRSVQQATRFTSLDFFASYPFSRRSRVEGSLGYAQRRLSYPQWIQQGDSLVLGFTEFSDDFPLASIALVNDTTRYQEWGPFQGRRLRIELSGLKFTGGDSKGETVTSVSVDFRAYQHLTRRSLLAFRATGVRQRGERAGLYSLGGINQLRGYEYREFFGPNVLWGNVELRFPLIDQIDWGFGLRMGPVRGFVFADAGAAWWDDTLHLNCTEPEPNALLCDPNPVRGKAVYDIRFNILRNYVGRDANGRWVDIHGSAGLGFQLQFLGLPVTWAFAKVYDGKNFGPYRSSFYIVFDW